MCLSSHDCKEIKGYFLMYVSLNRICFVTLGTIIRLKIVRIGISVVDRFMVVVYMVSVYRVPDSDSSGE